VAATYPIDVRLNPANVVSGSRRIKGELRGIRSEGKKTQGLLLGLFGGAAIGAGIGRGIGLLADFSQEMSTVRAVSRATDKEFSLLQKRAQSLGTTTRFSAKQAAEGMTFLARAGFNANEVLGTIDGTLQLAQAGGLGLGRAADIASNALQGFGLEVAETGRVVDVLALAANSSNTSVAQLGNALSFAAPIASGLGVSIEETTAAIGALSNAGLQGSRAGTGLNRVLAELESPTKATRDILNELGVSVDDVKISSVGLAGALEALEKGGITTGQALEAFGQRGGPAFDVLSKAIPDIQDMTRELDNAAGTAERVANTMDDNLNGAILAAKSAIQGLVLAVGEAGVTDALTDIFNGIAGAFRFAAENIDIFVIGLVAYTAQIAITAAAQSTLLATTIASTKAFFAKTAMLRLSSVAMIGAGVAARGLGAALLALAVNPVGIAITAMAAAFFLLRKETEEIPDFLGEADKAIAGYSATTARIEKDQSLLNKRVKEYKEGLEDIGPAAQDAALIEINSIKGRISKNKELLKSYKDVLSAQIEQAELNRRTAGDLAKEAGINTLKDTGRRTPSRTSTQFGELGNLQIFEQRSDQELQKAFDDELQSLRDLSKAEEGLSKKQLERFQLLSKINVEELEANDRLLRQKEALKRIEAGLSATADDSGSGGGGGGTVPSLARDFETELASLKGLTAAIGLNEAAQERANGVREFASKLERELTADEKNRVDAELRLQQVANDNQAQIQRISDIQQETKLLGENGREAEILAAIYDAEREALLGLSAPQRNRIRALIEEQQAVRDSRIINDRLDALDDESFLLSKIGTEARVATEILRLQNQLERELTDTELGWVRASVELNDEMERRNRIMRAAHDPAEEAKADMRSLIALYQEGKLTLAQYNRELQNSQFGDDILSLDRQLNSDGGDQLGLSEAEQRRRRTEQQLRQQEGGGTDDGSSQTLFGFGANELGVGDENERIRQQTQERLELIRQAREAEELTEIEFAERKKAILDQSIKDQNNILLDGLQIQLGATSDIFGSIAGVLRDSAGEQSGIYKIMLATQKAFAVAQATVSIAQGLARANELGFPLNLVEYARVAASAASIFSTIRGANFRDGGLPVPEGAPGLMGGVGGPREDANLIRISRGEYIVNADSTRRNLPILEYLNQHGELPQFRNGGMPSGPSRTTAPPRRAANGNGSSGANYHFGGVHISVPEGSTRENARDLGKAAVEGMVMELMKRESRPNGFLDTKFGKTG